MRRKCERLSLVKLSKKAKSSLVIIRIMPDRGIRFGQDLGWLLQTV